MSSAWGGPRPPCLGLKESSLRDAPSKGDQSPSSRIACVGAGRSSTVSKMSGNRTVERWNLRRSRYIRPATPRIELRTALRSVSSIAPVQKKLVVGRSSDVRKVSCGQAVKQLNLGRSHFTTCLCTLFVTERCAPSAGMFAAQLCELINNHIKSSMQVRSCSTLRLLSPCSRPPQIVSKGTTRSIKVHPLELAQRFHFPADFFCPASSSDSSAQAAGTMRA